MIEAWFETSHEPPKIIPVIVPSPELLEIAESAGFESDDLFSIEIPGGASRHTRIRVLVNVKDVPDLYSSAISVPVPAPQNTFAYPATALFRWRESSNAQAPLPKVLVWLLPPRPVFMYPTEEGVPVAPSSRGVMSVEAVDCRYWWARQLQDTRPESSATSLDERWSMTSALNSNTILGSIDYFRTSLVPGGGFIDASGIQIGVTLSSLIDQNRLANQQFPADISSAMQLDIALSAAGFMLIYDPVFDANWPFGRYRAMRITDERLELATWMDQDHGKRAYTGGLEPTSASPFVYMEPLIDAWIGDEASQYYRVPRTLRVSFLAGRVEGGITYDNVSKDDSSNNAYWMPYWTAFWSDRIIQTEGDRPLIPTAQAPASLGFEGRGITTRENQSSVVAGLVEPTWQHQLYADDVASLLEERARVCWGRIAWAGWPTSMPTGVYRGTMWRFALASRNGQIVPICNTLASEQDWLFGASINPVSDIRDIVFTRGNLKAYRLYNGALTMSSAPPNCRVFPAVIEGATRIGNSGDSYWQWQYTWREVEPNPLDATPLIKVPSSATMYCPVRRYSSTEPNTLARNLAEHGNNYVSAADPANAIAPGVLQSSNPNATIEPLPISVGTVVMMCEHALTLWINPDAGDAPPYPRQYWFSMPNAINVSCTP